MEENKKVTCTVIMDWLKDQVESKQPIGAHLFLEACQKLNVLIGDEHNVLYDLQQEVARLKIMRIESGDSVAKAKIIVEATEEYKKMKKQEARIEQIQEAIRISKIQARLSDTELRNQS